MNKSSLFTAPAALAFCLALLVIPSQSGAQTPAQMPAQQPAPPMATPAPVNVMREIKGIKLDMTRDEVKALLGKPYQAAKQSDEFKLDGGDLLTVRYGPQGQKVRVVQFYCSDRKRAPEWLDVVGDAQLQTKPNGSKYARRVVNAEKFWIAMFQSKSGGLTTITLSRQAN